MQNQFEKRTLNKNARQYMQNRAKFIRDQHEEQMFKANTFNRYKWDFFKQAKEVV